MRLAARRRRGTRLGDRACRLLVRRDPQLVTGEGNVVEAEHFDRHRRARVGDLLAVLVEQRPHLAPAAAGDHGVADVEDPALDEHRCHRAAAGIEVGLEHEGTPRRLRVRHERRVLDVGDEQDRVEQLRDAGAFGAGHLDHERVAAPLLGHELPLDELLASALRVGVALVDLRDRDDDGHLGRLGVTDGLDGLRHDAVVGCDDEHRDVGRLGAAGAHGGERLVTGRVDERDLPVVLDDLVRTDVLGDPTRFAVDDVRLTDAVEQRRLSVVDVPHHGHDWRARLEQALVLFFLFVVTQQRPELELFLLARLDQQHLGAEGLADELDHLVGQ